MVTIPSNFISGLKWKSAASSPVGKGRGDKTLCLLIRIDRDYITVINMPGRPSHVVWLTLPTLPSGTYNPVGVGSTWNDVEGQDGPALKVPRF